MSNIKFNEIDFCGDLYEFMKSILSQLNVKLSGIESPEDLCIKFLSGIRRRIPAIPRVVLTSKELKCPPKLLNGFSLVKYKIVQGTDLTPHLSKQVFDSNSPPDWLLWDWDIYHLHLGTKYNNKGRIKRTGPLLFARFDEKNAYLIQILKHKSFQRQELVEIIHANWPDSIKRFRINISMEKGPAEKEIKQWQKADINAPIVLKDGTVYGMMGGGFALSDENAMAVINCHKICDRIHILEQELIDNLEKMLTAAKVNGVKMSNRLDFHLAFIDGEFAIIERNSHFKYVVAFPEFPQIIYY